MANYPDLAPAARKEVLGLFSSLTSPRTCIGVDEQAGNSHLLAPWPVQIAGLRFAVARLPGFPFCDGSPCAGMLPRYPGGIAMSDNGQGSFNRLCSFPASDRGLPSTSGSIIAPQDFRGCIRGSVVLRPASDEVPKTTPHIAIMGCLVASTAKTASTWTDGFPARLSPTGNTPTINSGHKLK